MLLKHIKVDVKQLEANFIQHIKNQKPVWVDEIRSLETGGKIWHQIAFPKSNAIAWNQQPLPDSFSISIAARILRGTGQQLNLRIGKSGDFIQFSLTAKYGVNVFRFRDKKWQVIHKEKLDSVVAGRLMKLQLVRDPAREEIQLILGGDIIFQGELELDRALNLGLGAQKGSAIAWSDLTIEDDK